VGDGLGESLAVGVGVGVSVGLGDGLGEGEVSGGVAPPSPRWVPDGDGEGEGEEAAAAPKLGDGDGDAPRPAAATVASGVGRAACLTTPVRAAVPMRVAAGRTARTVAGAAATAGLAIRWATRCTSLTPAVMVAAAASTAASLSAAELAIAEPRPPPATPTGAA
jgi:hypothetical protein